MIHLPIHRKFVKGHMENGKIKLPYCSKENIKADGRIKPLMPVDFLNVTEPM